MHVFYCHKLILSNLFLHALLLFLALILAGCCPFLAHLQSTYPEASLELLTVDIRAKQTPKPNFPLRLPVPTRCFSTITIPHGGPNTSSPPMNKTCLQVMTPTTTLYARRRGKTKTTIPSNLTTSASGTLLFDDRLIPHTVALLLHHPLDTNPRTHRTPRRATSRIHTDPLQPKLPALSTYSESSARKRNNTANTSKPMPLPRVD